MISFLKTKEKNPKPKVEKVELVELDSKDPDLQGVFQLVTEVQNKNQKLSALIQQVSTVQNLAEQGDITGIDKWLKDIDEAKMQSTLDSLHTLAASKGGQLSIEFKSEISKAVLTAEKNLGSINLLKTQLINLLDRKNQEKEQEKIKKAEDTKQRLLYMAEKLTIYNQSLSQLKDQGNVLLEEKTVEKILPWITITEATVMPEEIQKDYNLYSNYGLKKLLTDGHQAIFELIKKTASLIQDMERIKKQLQLKLEPINSLSSPSAHTFKNS